jgi:hypothetical protein
MQGVGNLDRSPGPMAPGAGHVCDHSGDRLGAVQQRPGLVDAIDTAVTVPDTANEMVLVMSDGTRETWTRAPA